MINADANAVRLGNVATSGNDAIEILLNDHQVVKGLFEELAGAEPDERAAVLEQLKELLTVHNATEENLIYPSVRFIAGRTRDAETLYHQQDEAEASLWSIDATIKGRLDGDDAGEQIQTLQKAVLAHIRKEEETEFPHLREALTEDALEELTGDVRAFRETFRSVGR